ncbi:MAG: fumarylacetoacetate hydrolase family protein, partial [Bdellovibrionales bacterium]|nr:fumarylacetoacetate hydrolase family protein [Bdellovibrionales bacterium]
QDKAKEKSLPWSVAKGFDTFSGVSDFHPFSGDVEILKNLNFSLLVNNEIRQQGNTKDMIFSIPQIISYLSTVFTLSPGDIIFTGTPAGVSPLKVGDKMLAQLDGLASLNLGVI